MRVLLMGAFVAALILITPMLWSRDPDIRRAHGNGIQIVVAATTPARLSSVEALTLHTVGPSSPAATATPFVQSPQALDWISTDSENEPRALFAQLRREPRDGRWAADSENKIETQLRKISDVGGSQPLRVTCGSTVCEAAGSFAKDLPNENLNTAMEALQAPALGDALKAGKMAPGAQTYDSTNGRTSFTLYFMRAADLRP